MERAIIEQHDEAHLSESDVISANGQANGNPVKNKSQQELEEIL